MISVVVATYGEIEWASLAVTRASASVPGGTEVIRNHEPEGTVSSSRNEGAERAKGEWLCFLDADDQLERGYLKTMENAIKAGWWDDPLLAPAVSYVHMPEGDRTAPSIPNFGRWPLLNECVIGTVLRRETFMRVGGFQEWDSLEDYDLWLRCVADGAQIVHVPSAVYLASRTGGLLGEGRNRNQSPYHRIVRAHRGRVPGLR